MPPPPRPLGAPGIVPTIQPVQRSFNERDRESGDASDARIKRNGRSQSGNDVGDPAGESPQENPGAKSQPPRANPCVCRNEPKAKPAKGSAGQAKAPTDPVRQQAHTKADTK